MMQVCEIRHTSEWRNVSPQFKSLVLKQLFLTPN